MAAATRNVTSAPRGGAGTVQPPWKRNGTMKAATKLLARRTARTREAQDLRSLRRQDAASIAEDKFFGQQLPMSLAPYRLQAADRWWRETGSSSIDAARKRHS
jgi:hypothetical protein